MNDQQLEMENLPYADKQAIAKAMEDSKRLKEIRATQSPEERIKERKEVSRALSGMQIKKELHQANKVAEDDKEMADELTHKIKKIHNELF